MDIFNEKNFPTESPDDSRQMVQRSGALGMMNSTRSWRPSRTTYTTIIKTISNDGSQMPRQNPQAKSRRSEHSSGESETSSSLCSDWPHYTLDTLSRPPEKSADPKFIANSSAEGKNNLYSLARIVVLSNRNAIFTSMQFLQQ